MRKPIKLKTMKKYNFALKSRNMKIKFIFLFMFVSFLFVSCHFVLQVEKRKYTKGYYVELTSKKKVNEHKYESNSSKPKIDVRTLVASKDSAPFILKPYLEYEKPEIKQVKNEKQVHLLVKESPKTFVAAVSKEKCMVSRKTASTGAENPKEKYFLLFSALFSLLTGGIFLAIRKKVQKLSRWAKENKWKARMAIAGSQIVMGAGGFIAGNILYDHGIHIHEHARSVFIASFILGTLFYPFKKPYAGIINLSYLKQKAHDLILSLSGFFLMICAGNTFSQERVLPSSSGSETIQYVASIFPQPIIYSEGDTLRAMIVHHLVGDIIDSTEKSKYHLFPFWKKEEYKLAQFFQKNDGSIFLLGTMKDGSTKTILYSREQFEQTTSLINSFAGKEDQEQISHVNNMAGPKKFMPREDKNKLFWQIPLLILCILAAYALILLTAAFSCELACAGNEGAAIIVLNGGIALTVYLLVIAIRSVFYKRNSLYKG